MKNNNKLPRLKTLWFLQLGENNNISLIDGGVILFPSHSIQGRKSFHQNTFIINSPVNFIGGFGK